MTAKAMRRRVFDVTLGALLVAAGAFGLAHVREYGLPLGSEGERSLLVSVGNLVNQAGNVRYRFGESAVWHDVGSIERVAFGDAIFTAHDGHAEVVFKSGKKAEVLPNSLVVIQNAQDAQSPSEGQPKPLIEIKKGRVRFTHLNGKKTPLLFAANGKTYRIAPRDSDTSGSFLEVGLPETPPSSVASIASVTGSPGAGPKEAPLGLEIRSDVPVAVTEVKLDTASTVAGSSDSPLNRTLAEAFPAASPSPAPASSTPAQAQTQAASALSLSAQNSGIIEEGAARSMEPTKAQTSSPRQPLSSPMAEPPREEPPLEVGVVALAQDPQNQTVSPAPRASPTEAIQGGAPNRYGLLDVAPIFSYSKISSTDLANGSQVTLLSNLNYGFHADWRQHWSDRLETGLYFDWMATQLVSIDLNKGVQSADNSLSSFGAEASYRLLPGLILEGFIGMQQELVVMASDPVTLRVDRLSSPTLGADLRVPLLDLEPFSLQLWVGGSVLAPQAMGSYSVELGEGYGGGLKIAEKISSQWDLYGEGSIHELHQPTTLTTQSGEEILFSMGLRYRIGEPPKK